MPIAQLNGQRIHYQDTEGDGPVVVLAHGFLLDSRMFAQQVQHLHQGPARCRCITWDARGHGLSLDGAALPFSFDDVADDLEALLAHLQVEQALCLGTSQGGQVVLRHALRHPGRVRALALLATQARPEDPLKLPGYASLVREWSGAGLSPAMCAGVTRLLLGRDLPPAVLAPWHAHWATLVPAQVLQCFHTLSRRDDLWPRLHQLRLPVLVLQGLNDSVASTDRAEALAQELPQGRLLLLPGAGHAPSLSHPQAVHAALDALLAEVWPVAQPFDRPQAQPA